MKITALLLATLSLLPLAADAAQPNIVLILADDLGYGDVRCYNDQSKVPTPHIDRLAREGMRFTDAHSPCTVCTPTRYSLMTGQMAFRVPNDGTVFTGVGGPSLIAPGRLTLPSMLRDNGYATACCPTTDWLYAFIENDRVPVPPTGPLDKLRLPKHPYANDCRAGLMPDFPMEEVDLVFLKKSREFPEQHVRQSPSKPFFLFHSAQAVHLPSFAALDKLANQKLMQAIIVVPEKAIGASFRDEPLSRFGFWADWKVEPKWNLCDAPGSDNGGKVDSLKKFLESGDKVLVCTHATFRFAVETMRGSRKGISSSSTGRKSWLPIWASLSSATMVALTGDCESFTTTAPKVTFFSVHSSVP